MAAFGATASRVVTASCPLCSNSDGWLDDRDRPQVQTFSIQPHKEQQMQIDLVGKTALITGSTEGIGYAIARQLARAGADVVINGRSEEKTANAAKRLKGEGAGGTVAAVAADVATAEGCDALVAKVPHVDILINNAGIFQPLDFFEANDEVWDRHWQVNVMSAVRLSRAYLPGMQNVDWGRVIFIASESGFNIPVEMIHYGVSKTADIAVARGLAKRMAGTGVTVNSVLPGPTLSEGVEAMLAEERAKTGKPIEEVAADFVKKHRGSSIIQRAASVEEIANLVTYLASPLASATTGASMRVDGGLIDTL
ncbi:NAD(P)-dependent dehydrogenase (short-subunit alcohol dehydrogenase family) [Rhizobium redzepovicii]